MIVTNLVVFYAFLYVKDDGKISVNVFYLCTILPFICVPPDPHSSEASVVETFSGFKTSLFDSHLRCHKTHMLSQVFLFLKSAF